MATGRVPTTANSPLTAKGDLFTYSTAPARLAVGNNGEQIVADSAATTGLRYQATTAAGKNSVINGGFDVWQRGTSFTATVSSFGPDRWQVIRDAGAAGATFSRQVTGDTTNLPFIQYAVRGQRDSANTNTNTIYLVQSFETVNSIPLAGRAVTISFYARAGANYSAASNALGFRITTGTGTDQNLYSGYTGGTNPILTTAALTTTWQRFQATATLPTNITEAGVMFTYAPVGTAGAADYFEVTGVQVELGSVATAFSRAGATIQGELAACQRYYQLGAGFMAIADGTTLIKTGWSFKTTMRTSPSVSASAAFQVFYPGVDYTQSSANIAIESSRVSAEGAQLKMDNFTGLTAGRIYTHNVGNGNILLSAEL